MAAALTEPSAATIETDERAEYQRRADRFGITAGLLRSPWPLCQRAVGRPVPERHRRLPSGVSGKGERKAGQHRKGVRFVAPGDIHVDWKRIHDPSGPRSPPPPKS